MLFSLSELSKQSEFQVELSAHHRVVEFRQGDSFFDFPNVLVFNYPLVRQVLAWLRPLNQTKGLLRIFFLQIFLLPFIGTQFSHRHLLHCRNLLFDLNGGVLNVH